MNLPDTKKKLLMLFCKFPHDIKKASSRASIVGSIADYYNCNEDELYIGDAYRELIDYQIDSNVEEIKKDEKFYSIWFEAMRYFSSYLKNPAIFPKKRLQYCITQYERVDEFAGCYAIPEGLYLISIKVLTTFHNVKIITDVKDTDTEPKEEVRHFELLFRDDDRKNKLPVNTPCYMERYSSPVDENIWYLKNVFKIQAIKTKNMFIKLVGRAEVLLTHYKISLDEF